MYVSNLYCVCRIESKLLYKVLIKTLKTVENI